LSTSTCASKADISVVTQLHTRTNSLFKSTGAHLLMIFLPRYTLRASFSIFTGNSKPQPLLAPGVSNSPSVLLEKNSPNTFYTPCPSHAQESFLFIEPRTKQVAGFHMKSSASHSKAKPHSSTRSHVTRSPRLRYPLPQQPKAPTCFINTAANEKPVCSAIALLEWQLGLYFFFFPWQAAIKVENVHLQRCKPRRSWFPATTSTAAIKNKVSSSGVGGEIAPRS